MNEHSPHQPQPGQDVAQVAAHWILVALVGLVIAGASLSVAAAGEMQAAATAQLVVPRGISAL